ncbi:MAG: hypothetical protein KF761_02210 [Salinibacterium sp.]|nr:hypothetical protein [Salinibacterium sp.]
MKHRQSLFAAVLAIGIVTSFMLAGCATPSGGGSDGSGTAGGGGTSNDSPNDVNLDALHGVPSTFPPEVPLVDGDVPLGLDLGTGWSVVVKVDDYAKSYIEASGKLSAAGFALLQESTSGDGSFGVFEDDTFQIQVTASKTNDYGPAVSYVVVLRG